MATPLTIEIQIDRRAWQLHGVVLTFLFRMEGPSGGCFVPRYARSRPSSAGAWCRCLRFLFRKGDPSGGRFGPRYARSSLRLAGAWCRCSRCLFRMEGLSAECSGSRFARSRLRKTQRQMPQPKETSSRSSPRSFACTGLGHAWPEPAFLPLFKPIDPSDLLRFISTPGNAEADT